MFCLAFYIIIGFSISASAQQSSSIPSWVKNTAKWWHENSIGDDEFMKGIQYLINQKIIKISETPQDSQSTQHVPSWVKNIAGFWADGKTSDGDFTNAIEYLVKVGIIQVQITSTQTSTTPLPATPIIPTPPVTQPTISTNQNTASTVAPALPMLMLTKQYDKVVMRYPYNFVVKIFDPKTNPDKTFDQYNGGIAGVNVTVTILNKNNDLFVKLSGKTDDKGIYQDGVLIPHFDYSSEQMKVIVNATKKGYIAQSTITFFTVVSNNVLR